MDRYSITVGVDPSINSTGLCVYSYTNGKGEVKDYYCIGANCSGSKPSKETLEFYKTHGIKFIDYGKNPDRPSDYTLREMVKTKNIMNSEYELSKVLESVSEEYGGIDCVVMEGVSYGSVSGSSIVDLAGLNFVYREAILSICSRLVIASPMEIKKFAVGNGGVDKDIMIKVWSKCEGVIVPEGCKAKIDDIADAYFMSLYAMCQCNPDFEKSLDIPKVDIPKRHTDRKKQDIPDDVLSAFKTM
jgi:Holliday junction resolvasome RuvABC endonuclease subunit